jgi:hypothetical protein
MQRKIEKVGKMPGLETSGRWRMMKVNTAQSILVIAVGTLLDYVIDFVN